MIKNFKDVISQIKTQAPIHELISEFISIKKSGRGYVALCPFHNDKSPSMHIHSEKGIYKCFSCGNGGDAITFYTQITKKPWNEALLDLAKKYGITVEYGEENKVEKEVKDELFELNKVALKFFKMNLFLNEGKSALEYLKGERKLSEETIDTFNIGFALNSWDGLLNYLLKESRFSNELLIASGLFIQKENESSLYDRFRNRIIFPISDERGNTIAFGGRILPDSKDNQAKYINSPETLIYNKSQHLYGFNYAKNHIREKEYIILTEGYLDAISAHQYGLKNTVAQLGTALTSYQLRLISKYTKKLFLCLDNDSAGIKATESAFKLLEELNLNLEVKVINNLTGKDIDECLKKDGLDSFIKKIEQSIKIIEFVLEIQLKKYNTAKKNNDDLERKNIFEEIVTLLNTISDPITKNEYIKFTSHKLNIDEELIKLQQNKSTKEKKTIFKEKKKENEPFKMHTTERFKYAELELLLLYLCSFPQADNIKNELVEVTFIDEKHKYLKDHLDTLPTGTLTPQEIINNLILECSEYKHIMAIISELMIKLDEATCDSEYLKNKNKILSEAKEWINWWKTNKQEIKSLTNKLKDSESEEDQNNILKEMMRIIKEERKK